MMAREKEKCDLVCECWSPVLTSTEDSRSVMMAYIER